MLNNIIYCKRTF